MATPSPPRHLAQGPGARKEALRQRDYARRAKVAPYVELHAASAFSFLDGSAQPEDLVARAAELGMPAMALVDRNGVYGAPRFFKAAREAGIRPLVGAEVVLVDSLRDEDDSGSRGRPKKRTTRLEATRRSTARSRLTLLVRDARGYRNLCRLLTVAARDQVKGDAQASWRHIEEHAAGLHCLTGGAEGPLARALATGSRATEDCLDRLTTLFPGRLHIELQRHQRRDEEHRNRALVDLAHHRGLPLLATNGVRYAAPEDKSLHDVLASIRHGATLDTAGRHLAAERERRVKGADDMATLFADLPEALIATTELANELQFTLADLGYRFPAYPLPPGETAASFLRQVTWNAARGRFRPLTARAQQQIRHELAVIDKLDLAGYFLIVWDLIRFCKREGIMVQGRGSAANSAVCYALSITAVDPVKMGLLFERFLSEERGEWPDIDLDLPAGAQREKVIQYVYRRYGPHGAAMTANVITYRDRLAAREAAKALGFSNDQMARLSRHLRGLRREGSSDDDIAVDKALREAGFDPDEHRVSLFIDLWRRLQHLPRHLGQHSGGMVIAHGRLDEVVPVEPASMPGRVVLQWDKEDCADMGMIKIDLLGLGMLNALETAVPLVRRHERADLDLAHLPPDDPETFAMLRRADTVGVFQVESRAQMASLPRNRPEVFYDLVVQVAIIRPGPIVGGMVHPYFERRRGRAPVTYPHPSLEPVLARTLGVPLFQEQVLRMAMVAAGFSGGEAEQLRRAMGFKRSVDKMSEIEDQLRAGMRDRGIDDDAQAQIIKSITSFALYGFPESHAASFALIAYASAYLKAHHPTALLIGLLNAWPMGFYHPSSLIKDAQRHGVAVRPIDVTHSSWASTWEDRSDVPSPKGACRLGLRWVRGLRRVDAERIVTARHEHAFTSLDDFTRRCALDAAALEHLASAGALAAFGLDRRAASWQVAELARDPGPLFAHLPSAPTRVSLPSATEFEETLADFASTGISLGRHPVAYVREALTARGVVSALDLEGLPTGREVCFGGAIIVRQRPGTARGMLFITLEDETGMAQVIITPDLTRRYRRLLLDASGLIVDGELQRRDGSMSVKAERIRPFDTVLSIPSHDFR
ncbi:MAG: error-prone DNA polymerase [Acidobacteriota bacterium]